MKWIETRSENYVATIHGRDVIQDVEMAATEDGKILGFRVRELADMGAYLQLLTPGIPDPRRLGLHGAVRQPGVLVRVRGIVTNATPTDAYRGAGRPEATFVIERVVDALARQLGMDPAEIRRMNFMPPFTEARPPRSAG